MTQDYVRKILKARVYDVAIESPLDFAPNLSRRLGNHIHFKREDLQPVFSFKLRGAYNKIAALSETVRQRGVMAASAGNHAQGVALAARKFGCAAVIVMPRTTPSIKVEAVKRLGASVILEGDSYSDAQAFAYAEAEKRGREIIHPFNDPEVIAGQGTVGLELSRQMPRNTHAVFIPVGGGGLAAGVSLFLKNLYPEIRMIGVEPTEAPTMYESLRAKAPVKLTDVGVFVDGVAVKQVGDETFRLCSEFLDEVILVDVDSICAAIKDVYDDTRSIPEPAGALALAGLKAYVGREQLEERHLVTIVSGANMNFNRLRHIAERTDLGEGREALLAVTIPEREGSFKRLIHALGHRGITEFNYRYSSPKEAHVYVGIEVSAPSESKEIIEALQKVGYSALDLSQSEVAKLHIRYLVGGRNGSVQNERIFRFEFPERPGALIRFLEAMRPNWNISLFHYRNFGADIGRVLAGIQVPPQEGGEFQEFLDELHYPYVEETESPACKLFL